MWFIIPAAGEVLTASRAFAVRGLLMDLRGAIVQLVDSLLRMQPPRIYIRHNLRDSARWVSDLQRETKFAMAVALTRTAKRLVPLMEEEVRKVFDKPTPFSVRAFGFVPATKATLEARVFIKPVQARYLLPNIIGGRRGQKPFERKFQGGGYWAPGQGIRVNAAGNLTRAQIVQIANKLRGSGRYGEVFIGKPAGHPNAPFGIWGRPKKGRRASGNLTPLLVRIATPTYKVRFDFHGVAKRHAGKIFNEEFSIAFRDAKRNIRPVATVN